MLKVFKITQVFKEFNMFNMFKVFNMFNVLREFLNENHTPYINHFIIVVKFFEIIYNFIIRRVQDNHGIFVNLGKRYLCGINIYITKTYSKAIQLFTFIPLNLELNFRMNSDSLSSLSNLSKL